MSVAEHWQRKTPGRGSLSPLGKRAYRGQFTFGGQPADTIRGMKRETRANLIFIGLFLSLSLPGAVILFKKKLDPTASRMGMPEAVRRRMPYMVPMELPDTQVLRVVPALSEAWVAGLNRERAGGAAVLMRGPLPVTSADRVVQVAAARDDAGGGATMFLLAWEGPYGPRAEGYRILATTAGGESFEGRVNKAESVPMPRQVRRELMQAGYVKPAENVTWVEVRFDAPVLSKAPLVLKLTYDAGAGEPVATSVKVGGN